MPKIKIDDQEAEVSKEELRQAIREELELRKGEYKHRPVKRIARNTLIGLSSLGDLGIDLANLGKLAGEKVPFLKKTNPVIALLSKLPEKNIPNIENKITKFFDPRVLPRDSIEKVEDAAMQAVASLPTWGGAGKGLARMGAEKLGKFLRSGTEVFSKKGLANVATAGTAAGVTQGLLESGESPVTAFALGAGAPIAGRALKEGLKKSFRIDPEKLRAAQNLGVDYTIGDVSRGTLPQHLSNVANKLPAFPGEFYQKRSQQLAEKIIPGRILENEPFGEKISKAAEKYAEKKSLEWTKLFDKTENIAEKDRFVDITPFINRLKAESKKEFEKTPKDFLKTARGELLQKLTQDEFEDGTIPFRTLINYKKEAGELARSKVPVQAVAGHSTKDYKRNEADLERLIMSHLQKVEPAQAQLRREVNAAYAKHAKKEKPKIAALQKRELNDKPESIAKDIVDNLQQAGGRTLKLIFDEIPNNRTREEVINTVLYKLGETGKAKEFSLTAFESNYRALQSNVKKLIKDFDPNVKRKEILPDVLDFIRATKDTMKLANFPGTASHIASRDFWKRVAESTSATITGGVAAGLSGYMPIAVGLIGQWALVRGIITNKKFINLCAKGERISNQISLRDFTKELKKFEGPHGEKVPQDIVDKISALTQPAFVQSLQTIQKDSKTRSQTEP